MNRAVKTVAFINFAIASLKLTGEPDNVLGSIRVVTSANMAWYIVYGVLQISLGILALVFVSKQELRATIFKKNRTVILMRILAILNISYAIYALVYTRGKLGTTFTVTPTNIILNLVFDFLVIALSILMFVKTVKLDKLKRNHDSVSTGDGTCH